MYRPLPNCVTIKNSPIEGLGLFAKEFIPANTDLGMTHVYDERFPDNHIRLPLGGFFNHSTEPNSKIVEVIGDLRYLKLVTIKDVQEGDEITAYYTLYQP